MIYGHFRDGPADEQIKHFARAPLFLRVVIDEDGSVDVLDLLDDEPKATEKIEVYLRSGVEGFLCGRGQTGSGQTVGYVHVPIDEPFSTEHFRDADKWRRWADTYGPQIEGKSVEEALGHLIITQEIARREGDHEPA